MSAAPDDVPVLYDRWSHTYDSDANRTRDLASEVLRTAIGAVVGGDVVELGCGTGRNTGWLAERSASVVGLDFSSGMLEKARARSAGDRMRFIEHDIRDGLPLDDESADLVVIMLVLEHVEEVDPVFSECARVLRPGGHLFTCELHPYRQWAGAQAQFTDPATGEADAGARPRARGLRLRQRRDRGGDAAGAAGRVVGGSRWGRGHVAPSAVGAPPAGRVTR